MTEPLMTDAKGAELQEAKEGSRDWGPGHVILRGGVR